MTTLRLRLLQLGEDASVTFVFGEGVFALPATIVKVGEDYVEVKSERDGRIVLIPFASIIYVFRND